MNMHLQRLIRGQLMDTKEGGNGGDGGLTAADIKSMEDLRTQFLSIHKQIREFVQKANDEIKATGAATTETKSALASLTETINTLGNRLDKIEAKGNRIGEGESGKTIGRLFVESADYKGVVQTKKARVEFDGFDIKAITNATGQNQPLVPDMRVPGVITTPNRRLRIRNLIPSGQTASNLVQYVKENVFTNQAGPQVSGSPTVASENATKNESDITFTLANAPVVTIAHFILASTQVLEDAPMLESYINGRLLYGLALEEEDEILNADGTVGQLTGLMASATAYNRGYTGLTKLDVLRKAITQLQLSEYEPEFIVVNPADWEAIELSKDTQNRYLVADPSSLIGPTIWGLPVIATNSMTAGQFLVANGSQAAQIWDRKQAAVELSREDSDNFRKNMVTILAEQRLALAIYRATALIKGDYSAL